jgi:hypothetical protein
MPLPDLIMDTFAALALAMDQATDSLLHPSLFNTITGTPTVAASIQNLDIADKQRTCIQARPPACRGGHRLEYNIFLPFSLFTLALSVLFPSRRPPVQHLTA